MLFIENAYLKEFEARILKIDGNQIILDQTVFYAKSGGQPGDTGILDINNNCVNIIDTIFDQEKKIIHLAENNIKFEIFPFQNIFNI